MALKDLIKLAWFCILANRLRSLLTVLGIVIGIASVIAVFALGQGAKIETERRIKSLGLNILFVRTGSASANHVSMGMGTASSLTVKDAGAIRQACPSVVNVAPGMSGPMQVQFGKENINTVVQATTPEYMTIRNMSVAEGRFVNQTDYDHDSRVCAIGATVANSLFPGGDPIGKRILVKGEFFEVIGLMAPKGVVAFQDLDDQIYVPLTTAYNYLFGFNAVKGQSVQYILVQARSEDEILPAQFQITNLIRLRHGIKPPMSDDFYVRSQMDLVQTSRAMSSVFSLLLAWSAGIALFVGGVGVMNIMLVSVAERTREIGIRKALGAKPRDILLQFVVEATLLSMVGGFGGILLGICGSYAINFFSHWTTSVTPLSVLGASLVSLTIGLFFGVYPARQAAKLDPIVALRAE